MVMKMGLFKKLLARFRKHDDDEFYDESWEDDDEIVGQIDYHNKEQRTDYVRNCLEKMADATKELENLNFEYDMVTSYLKDMEEIEELLPSEQCHHSG